MKKRLLSLITAAALMVGMLPAAFAGYENFTSKTTYPAGQFTDVPSTEWYAQNVQAAYEYKLVDGVNATQFKPNSNLIDRTGDQAGGVSAQHLCQRQCGF